MTQKDEVFDININPIENCKINNADEFYLSALFICFRLRNFW